MPICEYQIDVNLTHEQAWNKLRDFTAAIHYVPGLTKAEITTAATEGVGASRQVRQGRIVLDETVTTWREGEGFTLRLHRGEKGPVPPMTEAWFEYAVVQKGGKVFLLNRMGYEVGLGWLGKLLDTIAINKVVQSSVRDTTIAQKIYYETGETVSPERLQAAKASL